MRAFAVLALLGAGFLAGFVARGFVPPDPVRRAGRPAAAAPVETGGAPAEEAPEARKGRVGAPYRGPEELAAAGEPQEVPPPSVEPADAPAAEGDPIERWVKTMGSQWRAWASMQAGQKIDALLKELGFDEATAALIKQAIQKEAERQTERAVAMMLGKEEMDADAFAYFMGLPPDLSPELERELATFLGDGEIGVLRQGVQRAHKQQLRDLADMQINMMQLPELSASQREQVREVFAGRDVMTEQMTHWAEITRDRKKLREMIEGKGLREAMERNFAPTRERLQRILTPQQMERYRAYEERMVKQAETMLQWTAAMLEKQPVGQTPPGR